MAKELSEKEKQRRLRAEKMRKAMEIVTVIVEREPQNKMRNTHTTTADLCKPFPVKKHVMERINLARKGKLIFGRVSGERSTHRAFPEGRMLTVVYWIGRHGLGSVEQVMRRFHMDKEEAEQVLQAAFDQDMLILAGTLYGEPEVYVATEKGLENTGLINLSVSPLAARVEGHLRACVDKAIELELALGPGYKVLSERELAALNGRKQGTKRLASPSYYTTREDDDEDLDSLSSEGRKARKATKHYKTPDLLVVREDARGNFVEVIAIEVELTKKSRREGPAILHAYMYCHGVLKVIYCTSPTITAYVEALKFGAEGGVQEQDEDLDVKDSEDEHDPEEMDLDGREESYLVEGWEVADPDLDPGEEPEPDDEHEYEPPWPGEEEESPRVPILIEEMDPDDVPALRRMSLYKPLPVCSEAHELFRVASRNPKWLTDIKPQLLAHLEWICLNGMVTADALGVCFALPGGCEEAHESLLVAHGAGWLHRTELLRAEDAIFFATEEGLTEVGMDPKAWLVNYDYVAHYALSGSTCMRTRIGAHLAQEFPDLVVKTRWELRVDGFFSGEGMMNVSKVAKFSGEHKFADITLVDEGNPAAPYGIVLIYPYLIQLDRVKAAVDAWLVHPRCEKLLLYIDDEKLRDAVEDFVNEHEQAERVSVLALPISEREQALRIERSHMLRKAAEDERYLRGAY